MPAPHRCGARARCLCIRAPPRRCCLTQGIAACAQERDGNPDCIDLSRRGLQVGTPARSRHFFARSYCWPQHCPVLVGESRLRQLILHSNDIRAISNLAGCARALAVAVARSAPTLLRCRLHSLVMLDLTGNALQEISNLHATPALRVLLLGNNSLLRIGGLEAVPHLDVLDLHVRTCWREQCGASSVAREACPSANLHVALAEPRARRATSCGAWRAWHTWRSCAC